MIAILLLWSCQQDTELLLSVVSDSGVDFSNDLNYTQDLNPYTYRNYYNGAGVGIADFNNDGLDDIYFTGNQVDNRLYQNLGNLKFEDVTSELIKCSGGWSTGVSLVDINQDGLMDIYVCKAGPPEGMRRYNELFINKGNFQFEEKAEEYGLRIKGFSIHASFFDFDLDGDLDCYLLNNSLRSVGGYVLREGLRSQPTDDGNMLLVNDEGLYVNKSSEYGIYTSDIGFGLGVNTSDMNGDGWPDIYVANDFFEKDYFYVNVEGEKFEERGEEYFGSFSLGSMGVDAADIDDDGDLDILVAEMAPQSLERKKTKATYESWDKYQKAIKNGYAHQLPRNMLHQNDSDYFKEIGRLKGLDATEWSWAPLIFDINNDGLKDVFISNGIGKDLLDRDYLSYMADEQRLRELMKNRDQESLKNLIDIMPSSRVLNSIFIQKNDFLFADFSSGATDMEAKVSNGTALADLDNDGDLDMVISNVDEQATVLENNAESNFISITLEDEKKNVNAIGANIELQLSGRSIFIQQNPYRGFQSTHSKKLTIGLGSESNPINAIVTWTDRTVEKYSNLNINQHHSIRKGMGQRVKGSVHSSVTKIKIDPLDTIKYSYPPRIFNEFNKEKLLTSMLPVLSPGLWTDDESDFCFIGGERNEEMGIMDGNSTILDKSVFTSSARSKVVDMSFFDSDNDGDLDVYMAHGSRIFTSFSPELDDVFYENIGGDEYQVKVDAIQFKEKIVSGAVISGDFNNDGYDDLIIGERIRSDNYGYPCRLFFYINKRDNTFDLTDMVDDHPHMGLITDLQMADLDNNGTSEIIVSGEWMGIRVYEIVDNKFKDFTSKFGLSKTKGMWRDIVGEDIDNDGDIDLVGANQGLNSYLSQSIKLYVNDFDANGRREQIHTYRKNGADYPILDYDEITSQIPYLRNVVSNYSGYSKSSMNDLFDPKILESAIVKGLDELRSGVFINDESEFIFKPFPDEIQVSSMHSIEIDDVNDDDISDIIIGGNHSLYKPQFGRDDASRGHLIIGEISQDEYDFSEEFSLNINGEIRVIEKVDSNKYIIGVFGKDLVKYRISYE